MTRLEKEINAAGKRLKRLTARVLRGGLSEGDARALADNHRMLTDALSGLAAGIRRGELPEDEALLASCRAFAVGGEAPELPALEKRFASVRLTLESASALPMYLGAAYALEASARYTQTPGEAESFFVRAVRTLHRLRELDVPALTARVSEGERLLRTDPGYRASDEETKAALRKRVAKRAEKTGQSELTVIRKALSADGGVFLATELNEKRRGGAAFLALGLLLPLLFTAALGVWISVKAPADRALLIPVLPPLYLSLVAAFAPLLSAAEKKAFPPAALPSLDPDDASLELPPVLITVSAFVPPAQKAASAAKRLEALYRSHSGSPAAVLALFDYKPAKTPVLPEDEADLSAMRREIDRLNRVHGGGFLLAVRGRVYAPGENEYTGHERKRGAIEALVRLMRENADGFETVYGDRTLLKSAKYLLALDADTRVPFETLRRLLCVAWHPKNRAVTDPAKRKVVSGYGCFAPRSEVSVASARATFFAGLQSSGGVSAYAGRVSSRYMDLFGESVFSGKGLIDVDVYHALCVDAFPEGRVLSHDILEGQALCTAFVSDCAFTESYPSAPAAFYRRQDRWIRGDIQNAAFLFRPGLGALSRFQLADNVRRALTPACCLALLEFSLCFPPPVRGALFLCAVLGHAGTHLFTALQTALRQGPFGFTRLTASNAASAGGKALERFGVALGFLPWEGTAAAVAVCRGMYRAFVSRRKTLEWTTAADAEKKGSAGIVLPVLSPLAAAATLAFGSPLHAALAALILLCVPFGVSDGVPRRAAGTVRLPPSDAQSLTGWVSAMWRYFEENAGAEDGFLPPDNVQETPVRRVAHRTSPTNIGLYLLCCLAAADLSLIGVKAMCDRLAFALDSLDKLPREDGMLYNWYDTRTLRPLAPAFISSVDEGNFLVCLTALAEGLEEYAPLDDRIPALIRWIRREIENARIETLYSPRRKLFSIGRTAAGTLSDSYYDCYMSEARLTSLFACAKRRVPVSHWAALDRAFLRRFDRVSAASYSGTMFEYFMPSLFLPVYGNTYAAAGLSGCLAEQRRRVRGTPCPYGISESAYYAFDAGLSYRYRAHGLRSLALRPDPDDENVFSPYSVFLTVTRAPRAAVKALRRYLSLGAWGVYGFYEAVDFTDRAMGEDYMIVRCYMAHHVGMSMLAAVNALRNDLFVKRFTRDPDIAGALSLLEEKIPAAAPVRRSSAGRTQRESAPKPQPKAAPQGALGVYSNGETSLFCLKNGGCRVLYGTANLLRYSERAGGVAVGVRAGGTLLLPLTGERRLTRTGACAKAVSGDLTVETAAAVLGSASVAAFPVKLKNTGKTPVNAQEMWYFEPDFTPLFSPDEHPAFTDLNLRFSFDAGSNALLIRRLERGRTVLAAAVGFYDFSPFTFCCDRETLLGHGSRRSPFDRFPKALDNAVDFSFPGVGIRTEVRLPPEGKTERVLLFCPASDAASALASLARVRSQRLPSLSRAAPSPFTGDAGVLAQQAAMLLFGAVQPDAAAHAAKNAAPLSALWEQGVSGDVPVLRARTFGLPETLLRTLLRAYRMLRFCGVRTELVLLTRAAADYRGTDAALTALMKSEGLAEGDGVRVLPEEGCSKAFLSALSACRGLEYPFVSPPVPPPPLPEAKPASPLFTGENTFVPDGFFIGTPPPRPWCHTLSNPVFGTLLSHDSIGFTWALNARMNPLTPRHNDPCTPFPGETLLLSAGETLYNAVSGASVYFLDRCALYGSVCGGVELRILIEVDAAAMKKRLRVQFNNNKTDSALRFLVRPMPGAVPGHAVFVKGETQNGALIFENPANADFGGAMAVYTASNAGASFENGVGELRVPLPGERGEVELFMAYAASKKALLSLMALPFRPPAENPARLTVLPARAKPFADALLLHGIRDTRVNARAGFYQCSGAWGFRDQLQDTMNLCDIFPDTAKRQLFRCAAAQFPEGDVLHWFHVLPRPVPRLSGVRTRCSDDMLWLPLAAARYVGLTGDLDPLTREIPYLAGEPLGAQERERYACFEKGDVRRTLYDHCLRAVRRACRFGAHGLPLMGGGDWNDAFGEAGLGGKGESVWLALFLSVVCARFAETARRYRDGDTARELAALSARMNEDVVRAGYNGKYFLRGFYDSGAPMGDASCGACRVDLLPQAFASFAGAGTPAQRKSALLSAMDALYDPAAKTLRLLYPPFGETGERAGYVNDYPPGCRENGGQYTHAAVWFYMALRNEGLEEQAAAVLETLLPDKRETGVYLNEPYAVSGDIGMQPSHPGRGGWSLYTGASGWLKRALAGETDL